MGAQAASLASTGLMRAIRLSMSIFLPSTVDAPATIGAAHHLRRDATHAGLAAGARRRRPASFRRGRPPR
jgi:hypothetical protein